MAVVAAALVIAAVTGVMGLRDVREPAPGLFVPADLPSVIAALPDGGFRYGELRTGRVYEIGPDGTPRGLLAELDVATNDELGLMGLAVDSAGSRTFAAWVDGEGRLQVSELTAGGVRPVWAGPIVGPGSSAALAWSPPAKLVIGTGDRDARDGVVRTLDPDGSPGQAPVMVSSQWYPPLALTYDGSNRLWVADQPPARLRVARGDAGPDPDYITTEDGAAVPSGIAAGADTSLLVCDAAAGSVVWFTVGDDGVPAPATSSGSVPCERSIAALSDGRIAVGLANGIRVLDEAGVGDER